MYNISMKKYKWQIIVLSLLLITFSLLVFLRYWPKSNPVVNLPKIDNPIVKTPEPIVQDWTMMAVGDIMLGREVDARMDKNGRDYPFLETTDTLISADLTFGNLEAPFSENDSNHDSGSMNLTAETASVEGLKNAGFDILGLATNHFDNAGTAGELLTIQLLTDNNIKYCGAGKDDIEAHTPAIIDVKGQKVAFLAYNDRDVASATGFASTDRPGTAPMNIEAMQADIANAKTKSDMIIVSMHSGTEYTPNPNARQIEFAHSAIDAGADLIIGHHPHVVQATENYKDKMIFYSLGNFVFDQPWSTETKQGIMVKFQFKGKDLTKYDIMPIKIGDWAQPNILPAGDEYNSIMDRINVASEKLKE